MDLPSISDFARHGVDPGHYARLAGDWSLAVADVTGSTKLAAAGRDRDVNFVAGGAVAVLGEAVRREGDVVACQFGGDGAIAAVPPERMDQTKAALGALAHWAKAEYGIDLRVGLVPVAALRAAGFDVFAALQDFGNDNAFGLFLGDGVVAADAWVKADARWHVPAKEGPLPGLEGLSCRWRPVPTRRGTVLCVIFDPTQTGAAGLATLGRIFAEIDMVVPTRDAAPLGTDGERLEPKGVPGFRSLWLEAKAQPRGRRVLRVLSAVAGALIIRAADLLGGRLGPVDVATYKRGMAERSDYRKAAGGPRLVLDVTDDEATRIEALLARAEEAGEIRYGTARADATTITCLVGDFSADRHVHFVDGAGLGFWRAAEAMKAKARKAA
ncbi:MAG: DUF3095 family protein [Rhodospirillales bacterium]|nr:DUF3095 family protein [Rhodospirillales bacterium]